MKHAVAAALVAGLAAFAPPVQAQPVAVVDGVLMPAWVERAGVRSPLAAGMELRSGDAVRTGSGSRLAVKLLEGSLVRLGQNGLLELSTLDQKTGGPFRAALRVGEGAFRFTTDRLVKSRQRDVTIVLAGVTTAVRGTDLWGKQSGDRQTVCLIEGKIEVGAAGETPVVMDQARQFYRREKGRTQPVGFVSREQIAAWSKETDIEGGKGGARRGGKWTVTLVSTDSERTALAIHQRLGAGGYAAEIQLTKFGNRSVYDVLISNLASKPDADALAAKLRDQYGVADPRISSE